MDREVRLAVAVHVGEDERIAFGLLEAKLAGLVVELGAADELFLLQTMGDDRAIRETYVAGKAMKAGL